MDLMASQCAHEQPCDTILVAPVDVPCPPLCEHAPDALCVPSEGHGDQRRPVEERAYALVHLVVAGVRLGRGLLGVCDVGDEAQDVAPVTVSSRIGVLHLPCGCGDSALDDNGDGR